MRAETEIFKQTVRELDKLVAIIKNQMDQHEAEMRNLKAELDDEVLRHNLGSNHISSRLKNIDRRLQKLEEELEKWKPDTQKKLDKFGT